MNTFRTKGDIGMPTDIKDVNWAHMIVVALVFVPFWYIGNAYLGHFYFGAFSSIRLIWPVKFSLHFFLLGLVAIPLIGIENRLIWYKLFTVKLKEPAYYWPSPIVVGLLVGFLTALH